MLSKSNSKSAFYLSSSRKYFQSPWDFFDKPDRMKGSFDAKCKLCTTKPALIKRTNGNTSGMRKHLQRIHNLHPLEGNGPKTFATTAVKSKKLRNGNIIGKLRANCSWVWRHFSIIDEQSAVCSICGKFLARSATTGLIKHLKRVHSIFEEFSGVKIDDTSDTSDQGNSQHDIFDTQGELLQLTN